jgi:hypothetical protein
LAEHPAPPRRVPPASLLAMSLAPRVALAGLVAACALGVLAWAMAA